MTSTRRLSRSASIGKYGNAAKEMAVNIFAMMQDSESKLVQFIQRLVKERQMFARHVLSTDVDGWTPLHASVLRGSKKLIKVVLTSGIDINTPMGEAEGLPELCTPLHIACWRGNEDVIKLLLSHGADINGKDGSGKTPVMYAVKRRNHDVVRLMERKGADMTSVKFPSNWRENKSPKTSKLKHLFFS